MSRLPYAAHVLIQNVMAYADTYRLPDPIIGRYGAPDGLDVVRSLLFDVVTSEWLTPLLAVIVDQRVIAASRLGDGLVVTFHHGPKADNRAPFPLVDAALVLGVHHPAVPETGEVADLHDPLTLDEAP